MVHDLMKTDSTILKFYLNRSPDIRGRMLDFIWQQNHEWLEKTHDYIQWLFPLQEKSLFNPHAPILTEEDIYGFKSSQKSQENLVHSLRVMLSFYGLKIQEPNLVISLDQNSYMERRKQWLHWGNHNHMRITRILKSLRLLGLGAYAKAYFDALEKIYFMEKDNITKLTFSYWEEAVDGIE